VWKAHTITIGSGNHDYVTSAGDFFNNTISIGNGIGDYVTATGTVNHKSGDNTIALGNGNNDSVTLAASSGNDVINTGTGANDQINVGRHGGPDKFGFALGTNGSHFTTVTGAVLGDLVDVNGGTLGTASLMSHMTMDTTLASYIKSLGTLTAGATYVGYNTTAHDTFVVTDTLAGQTGAIELTGVVCPRLIPFQPAPALGTREEAMRPPSCL
jgi:hypothetical protein